MLCTALNFQRFESRAAQSTALQGNSLSLVQKAILAYKGVGLGTFAIFYPNSYTIALPHYLQPRCPHFTICNGCQQQHLPYEDQLKQKRHFVSTCFGRECAPVIPSIPEWRYRNKMEFSFSESKRGEKFLGLMRKRGRVENLYECHLTALWFADTVCHIREWWHQTSLRAYHPFSNSGELRTLTLREGIRTQEKMAVLTTSQEEIAAVDLATFLEAIPYVDVVVLRKQIIQKKVPTRFEESILKGSGYIHETLFSSEGSPYHFRITAASFFQPNTYQAEKIYQEAIGLARLTQEEYVLDLFCGTGAVGMFAARYCQHVYGIELVPTAVADCHHNLMRNQITNMSVIAGDVAKILPTLSVRPTTVFIDPPRAGLGKETIAHLLHLRPEKILYISCNPVTQAADCAALGYTIQALQPIDQFPHTPHVENIALLSLAPTP